ncbi:hypothetical protein EY643_14945 [Halioglobus maricola]|uniref:Metal-dependent hydrolase n=1 Tax=Halioglobus maricola TaxID=2601894 RepID=A0A5P9NLZ9_9GAMM|nr:hypothetical protein [Halioglobus maricola]QFU76841.1 hypothetical protein EY643_14945 [Halioglobus maricola]
MLAGHFAVGYALKAVEKTVPLWVLLVAVQFVDIFAQIFIFLGLERMFIPENATKITDIVIFNPYTHSLISVPFWSLLFVAIFALFRPVNLRIAAVLIIAVASHWILDFVVHVPDLPLSFSPEEKFGLGLWNYPLLSAALETVLLLAGIALCLKVVEFGGLINKLLFWLLCTLLLLLALFGSHTQPPSTIGEAVVKGLMLYTIVPAFAYFSEKRIRKNSV